MSETNNDDIFWQALEMDPDYTTDGAEYPYPERLYAPEDLMPDDEHKVAWLKGKREQLLEHMRLTDDEATRHQVSNLDREIDTLEKMLGLQDSRTDKPISPKDK